MKSNSMASNARKLKKYRHRLAESHDSAKNRIYNQKIQFYQQIMTGGGVNYNENSNIDTLISKIDALIQQSRATRGAQTQSNANKSMVGGSKASRLQGSRVMSDGMRGQKGGAGDADLARLLGEAAKSAMPAVIKEQEEVVRQVRDKLDGISTKDKEKDAKIQDLLQQIKLSEAKIRDLEQKKGRIEQGIEVGSAELDELRRQTEADKKQIADLTKQLEELRVAKDAVDNEIAGLRKQIEEGKKDKPAREENEKLKIENEKIKGDDAALKEEMQKLRDQLEGLQRDIEQARKQCDAQKGDLEKTSQEHKAKIDELKAQNERAKAEVAKINVDLKDMRTDLEHAKAALRKLIDQNTALSQNNKQLMDVNDELIRKIDTISKGQRSVEDVMARALPQPEEAVEEEVEEAEEGAPQEGGKSLDELLAFSVPMPSNF